MKRTAQQGKAASLRPACFSMANSGQDGYD
jgi:hypothetical protein